MSEQVAAELDETEGKKSRCRVTPPGSVGAVKLLGQLSARSRAEQTRLRSSWVKVVLTAWTDTGVPDGDRGQSGGRAAGHCGQPGQQAAGVEGARAGLTSAHAGLAVGPRSVTWLPSAGVARRRAGLQQLVVPPSAR